MKLILLPLDEKKNVLQIVTAFEFKNRAEKNTFAAHGKCSRAELLETAPVRGKFKGHLHVSGKPWEGPERGGILDSLFYGESKNVREDPGDHISSHSPRGPAVCWRRAPEGERSVNNWGGSVPCLLCGGITVTLFLETAPEVKEAMPVGPPISTLSTNRSQTESWSLAISVDTAKIGWSQV